MIKIILFTISAVASVQCFSLYPGPYSQPCSCGMPASPAMPAFLPPNPPCANPAQISIPLLAAPYDMPLPSKLPLMSAPYEVPMALPATMPKAPVVAAPLPVNLPVGLPLPAPVTRVVAQPSCGCLDALPNLELPLPLGLPIGNPFLPAASPVSALAPYSMLPPACPCSRCQYLKKIPIPPPCI